MFVTEIITRSLGEDKSDEPEASNRPPPRAGLRDVEEEGNHGCSDDFGGEEPRSRLALLSLLTSVALMPPTLAIDAARGDVVVVAAAAAVVLLDSDRSKVTLSENTPYGSNGRWRRR